MRFIRRSKFGVGQGSDAYDGSPNVLYIRRIYMSHILSLIILYITIIENA